MNNLPVYLNSYNAIWINPAQFSWTGGRKFTYDRGQFSTGTLFSAVSATDPVTQYCIEHVPSWREANRMSQWTPYGDNDVSIKCN